MNTEASPNAMPTIDPATRLESHQPIPVQSIKTAAINKSDLEDFSIGILINF